jgi:hypothetical protein
MTPMPETTVLEKWRARQSEWPAMQELWDALAASEQARQRAEEALAADLAYHSNNTGLNMRWRKEALAALPKGWAQQKWPLLAALAEDEPKRLLPWDEYVKKVRAAAAGEKPNA